MHQQCNGETHRIAALTGIDKCAAQRLAEDHQRNKRNRRRCRQWLVNSASVLRGDSKRVDVKTEADRVEVHARFTMRFFFFIFVFCHMEMAV